ncbi:hypothetical protein [Cohnella panacarvi]|uniref:hypothetical protein n=1 Tax=Cohnella panacarvi TaxID=400776 RepID=UPI0004799E5F|nr:hypothetical protein [Cohnella panacarvi]
MRKIRKLLALLATFSLLIGLMNMSVYAEGQQEPEAKIIKPVTLGTVKLKENVTAIVNNVLLMPSDNNQVLSFTLSITNNSNSELNVIDYWANVSTKSGTKMNVQMATNNVNKVPAKTSANIIFFSKVANNIKLSDLIIKVIQWDFSATNYSRVLGEVSVAARYNPVTPANSGIAVAVEDVETVFTIKQTVMGKSESYYRPEIKLNIKNNGKRAVTLPDYQLYVITGNNVMFPLENKGIKGTVLNPLMEKEFTLTVSIPLSAKAGGWKLGIMNPILEGKEKIPVALFELVESNVQVGEQSGKYYSFTNAQGMYYIKLDSVNRLPFEDDDLIVSNLTLANKSTKTLTIPKLSGEYLLNDSIEVSATSNNNDKLIALKPGETTSVQLVGKVPYTFDISKMNVTVQQSDTGSGSTPEVTDLVEFAHSGEFTKVKEVAWNTGFKIEDVGYRSDVKISEMKRFIGLNADIIAAQIQVVNSEKRQATLPKLAGYYEKDDGTIYPVNLELPTEKVAPNGNAILYAWATIPKTAATQEFKLVLGKAVEVKSDNASGSGQSSTQLAGYLMPYSFVLPADQQAKTSLADISMSPFTLTFNQIRTQLEYVSSTVSVKFDYNLTQDLLTRANLKDHKIVIEIKDKNNSTYVFSKEVDLPSNTSSESTQGFAIGKNTLQLSWPNRDDIHFVLEKMDQYEFNVYYQIQPGYKQLIATQTIRWFADRVITP